MSINPFHSMRSLSLALIGLAICTGGCASSGPELGQGAEAAGGLMESAALIRAGQQDVRATMQSLTDLSKGSGQDLAGLLGDLSSKMDALEATAHKVGATNKAMREAGSRYFEKWDAEVAQINNEEIRARSEQRRKLISGVLEKVSLQYSRLTESYSTYIGDLRDIRSALSADLTDEALLDLQDVIQSTLQSGEEVLGAAAIVAESYEKLGVRMGAAADEAPGTGG